MGGNISEQVVLGSIRKQAEQASRKYNSTAAVTAPASRSLPCLSSCPKFFFTDEQ